MNKTNLPALKNDPTVKQSDHFLIFIRLCKTDSRLIFFSDRIDVIQNLPAVL